jgi:hypothetical protein
MSQLELATSYLEALGDTEDPDAAAAALKVSLL